MKRIAIIGANGQVGSEVSLLLSMMPDVEVVPVCRTEIGSAFLRKAGLPVRHAKPVERDEMRRVLEGCDVVADFSLPVGAASEVRASMKQIIPNLAEAAPPGVPLVYLSSITAFGFANFRQPLKYYQFSRNVYGSCKRFGEHLARSSAAKTGRPAFVLRVGVVHGELQAFSRKIRQQVRTAGDVAVSVPDCESYAVFAVTITEALVAIARGLEEPGTYTMLPNPGVRWKNLHEWYCRRAGIEPNVRLLGPDPEPSAMSKLAQGVIGPVKRLGIAGKDVVAGYLTAVLPALERKLRTLYHIQSADQEIGSGLRASQYRPYGNNHTVFPGRRLGHLTEPLAATDRYAGRIQAVLQRALSEDQSPEDEAATELMRTAVS